MSLPCVHGTDGNAMKRAGSIGALSPVSPQGICVDALGGCPCYLLVTPLGPSVVAAHFHFIYLLIE